MTSPETKDCSKGIESLCLHDGDVDSVDITVTEDSTFDQAVGHIEDVLMDPQFQELQNNFLEKYWNEFEDTDENKLVYMDIFQEYTNVVEKYIEGHLRKNMKGFNMDIFMTQLQERKDDLEGEVFEMLFTFTDFLIFKEMFLDFKAVKEGRVEDLGLDIHVTSM